jgi:hypothetical protein
MANHLAEQFKGPDWQMTRKKLLCTWFDSSDQWQHVQTFVQVVLWYRDVSRVLKRSRCYHNIILLAGNIAEKKELDICCSRGNFKIRCDSTSNPMHWRLSPLPLSPP